MRYVRTQDKGWLRRRVARGTTRGWEQRIDVDLKHFGRDVIDLGEYQLRWFENRRGTSKPRYESAGTTYVQAKKALAHRQEQLALNRVAARAGFTPPPEAQDLKPLTERLEPFLRARKATKHITAEATCDAYRRALDTFLEATKVRYAERVTGKTLEDFLTVMRERGLSDQTQLNMYAAMGAFLRVCDPRLGTIVREYTPKVKKKNPEHYERAEIDKLLAYLYARPSEQRIALAAETFWKTGLRAKELSHLTWDLVDLERGFFTIKDDRVLRLKIRGEVKTRVFHTKTRRDRVLRIPIEPELLGKLRAWRASHPADRFLFPTSKGNPDAQLLLRIKIGAHRAGLSCGQCNHCLRPCGECKQCKCGKCARCRVKRTCINPHHGSHPCTRIQCEKWKLHRFRHTFATTAVRKGADIGMLMNLLGHSKLSTTQIYLSAAKEEEAQAAVSNMFS